MKPRGGMIMIMRAERRLGWPIMIMMMIWIWTTLRALCRHD